MMRLLRPPHSGIFWRSFRLHSTHYARETIAKICSPWVALATAIISQTGSCGSVRIGTGVSSPCIVLFAVTRRLR
jgi:hypothetical protein